MGEGNGEHGGSWYKPLMHAVVADDPGPERLALIVIGAWEFPDGTKEWCVECLDRIEGELSGDVCFGSKAEAIAHAEREFSARAKQWRSGLPDRSRR